VLTTTFCKSVVLSQKKRSAVNIWSLQEIALVWLACLAASQDQLDKVLPCLQRFSSQAESGLQTFITLQVFLTNTINIIHLISNL